MGKTDDFFVDTTRIYKEIIARISYHTSILNFKLNISAKLKNKLNKLTRTSGTCRIFSLSIRPCKGAFWRRPGSKPSGRNENLTYIHVFA